MKAITYRWLHSCAFIALKVISLIAFISASSMAFTAYAQLDASSIAKTYTITGNKPISGDVVSFDSANQTFLLSRGATDSNVFGVVVNEPAVVLRSSADGVPIVTSGELLVNVTTANGPIIAGDLLSPSSIPGKAQKADTAGAYILGTALESFPKGKSGTATTTDGSPVYSGTIRVLLHIGSRSQTNVAKSGTTPDTSFTTMTDTGVPAPIATLIKYLLATAVVVGTIYVAFRNFGSNMRDSIVSIGRNPLAKTSIQTMVIINTTLIVLVSAVGLFVGFMILFVPI